MNQIMVIHKACAATTKCVFKTICILIFTFTLKRNFVLKKMDFFNNESNNGDPEILLLQIPQNEKVHSKEEIQILNNHPLAVVII